VIDRLIAEDRFKACPDTIRLAVALWDTGLHTVLASSSQNADAMLARVILPDGRTLLSLFEADVSGRDVPRGKPDPALFQLAAKAVNVPPARCLVVEDAPAGIRAAPWSRPPSQLIRRSGARPMSGARYTPPLPLGVAECRHRLRRAEVVALVAEGLEAGAL